jgi:hypothetical protein
MSGTRSFIGVFGDSITIMSDQPIILPKLCIDITLQVNPKPSPRMLGLHVIFETEDFIETDLATTEFELPVSQSGANSANPFAKKDGFVCGQLSSQMQMANIPIAANGRIKVRGVDGDDLIALGSLGVKLLPQMADPID